MVRQPAPYGYRRAANQVNAEGGRLAQPVHRHGSDQHPPVPLKAARRLMAILRAKSRTAAVPLADQALVSLVNFSSFFLLAREMEEISLGHFAIAYTLLLVLTAFQQSLLTSVFQVKGARKEGEGLRRFTTVLFALQLMLGAGMALLFGLLGGAAMLGGLPALGFLAVVLGLAAAPWMTQDLARKVFYTQGRTRSALINDGISYGLQIAGVAWLVLRREPPAAWEAIAVYGAGSAVASLVGFVQLRDILVPRLLKERDRARVVAREIWTYGKWLAGAQAWRQLGGTGHTWIITLALGPAALGAYRALVHLVNVLNPIEMVISLWLPSEASRRYAAGGSSSVKAWFRKVIPMLLAPTGLGALLFLLFSQQIVELAYPGKYTGTGFHWIVALAAVGRLIHFGRDLYHNALLACDRPSTSLLDSMLTVGIKYVVGIPAILGLGILGAPAATLIVAITTLSYNRRTFEAMADADFEARQPTVWKTVGEGSEGRVFKDVHAGIATKVYYDDDAVDEAWRYYIGLLAAFDHVEQDLVSTPIPIEFEPDIPLIQMEACEGMSLAAYIRSHSLGATNLEALAERIWFGIRTIPTATAEPTYGLWPDNILFDRDANRVTFVDFITGERRVNVTSASMAALTLGGFLGPALYELSRPTRWFRPLANIRIVRLCRAVLARALRDGESLTDIAEATRQVYAVCSSSGSAERQAWYGHVGRLLWSFNSRRVFATNPVGHRPSGPSMICHYVTRFPTNDQRTANGVHKAVRGLAGGLHQLGTPTEILTDGGVRCSWITPDGVDVHAFRERGPVPGLMLPAEMKAHIDSLPERTLFVVHGQFSPRMTRVAAALRSMGRPYVVMPHTLYSDAVFAKNRIVKFIYWHLLERPMLKKASLIQILERDQAQPLRRRGVNTPAAVVPNAIDPADTPPEAGLTWSTTGPIRLYYLGRINFHQKALDILVKAVAQVRKEFDIHLTIQGPDAGDLETLKSIARQTGADQVMTILPPEFQKGASELIAEYDVFCMPSRIEGFPMAALEAMQAGRPLLFTNVSGLTETIEQSGCGELVSPTVGDVVRGLKTLCARRLEFEAMGRAGRDYVIRRYSPMASARIATAAYGRVIPGTAGRASARPQSGPQPGPQSRPLSSERPAIEPQATRSAGQGQGQAAP